MVFFTVKRKKNGREYLYAEERGYVGGKVVRTFQKYLGARERFGDIPLGQKKAIKPEDIKIKSYEFGISAAMWGIAQELGVPGIIDEALGCARVAGANHLSTGQYITLATINRVADPCSKTEISDWFRENWLHTRLAVDPAVLNAQTYWNHFQHLSPGAMEEIELTLANRAREQFALNWDHLLYDTTNFFTFAAPDAPGGLRRFGHGKENRNNLPLVNVYLLCSKPWGIPLLHHAYPGNDQDAKTFKGIPEKVAAYLRKLGQDPAQVTVGFDKGNLSPVGMERVDAQHLKFVASLKNSEHKDLLHAPRKKFAKVTLPGSKKEVEYFRTEVEAYGMARAVFVVVDPAKERKQVLRFNDDLATRKERAETFVVSKLNVKKWRNPRAVAAKLQSIVGKKNPWKAVLTFQVSGEPGTLSVTFAVDEAAKASHEETLGRSIIFTNQSGWAPEDVIWSYREQYVIEHAFKAMKDPAAIAIRPMYHWARKSIEGHVFTCVLALFLLAAIRVKLVQEGINMTYKSLLKCLRNLHANRVEVGNAGPAFFKIDEVRGTSAKLVKVLNLGTLLKED
jgi:transposase